ncbi:cbb3-type cytochrome c oxidase subunit I [Sodalinema gerasimenkoae]|uniref:cbb3-type cytochrome c oxidase subunit I n=1 Tax=Sodalinema gerasimenkoae TaxID=2862348 RepID=UPI001358A88C|nr:cbb3-type cytochrome c oxidase subunit I [Sodalinema gerasimenkoae]
MTNPTLDLKVARSPITRFSLPAWLVLVCVVTFTVLIGAGAAIYKNAPPIPATIVSPQQESVLTQENIQLGQETYLARGGQHIGSIWGHGSYLAPDWTADVLHRWGLATAGILYQDNPDFTQADWESLSRIEQAQLQVEVQQDFKTNRYDSESQALTLTAAQTRGLTKVFEDYHDLLSRGSVTHSIPSGWFTDDDQIRNVTAFFTWTAWAAAANRPNAPFSYTANFPHDDLIGNQAPPQFLIWSIVSIIVLIAAIALFLFIYLTQEDAEEVQTVAERPSIRIATPSQKVTTLFFGVAMTLFLVQMLMGMVTAHYAVEGDGFYGVPLQDYLPYAASRTWHLQLAVFWIATALALMLFALREITPDRAWNETWFNRSFWSINIGLVIMMVFGLIPSGFYQLVQSVNHGTWYARSAEVIGSAWMHWTVWLRIPGDIVFALGALLMVVCVLPAIVAIFQEPTQPQPRESVVPDPS